MQSEVDFLRARLADVTNRYQELGRFLGSALETNHVQVTENEPLKEQNCILVEVLDQMSESAAAAAQRVQEAKPESAVMSLLQRTAEIQLRQQEI